MSADLGDWDLDEAPYGHPAAELADDVRDVNDLEESPELYYGSVDEFVRNVVIEVYRRRVGPRAARRWSAQWWRSAEAVMRLEAMWRSWEHLRREPHTGMSAWMLNHGDPHMRALMDPEGPFASSEDANAKNEPLPYEAPPEGLFPDMRVG